jgi:3-deoxy-D-manno-octulosonate 8-phosphate phosphatase (KDO 8-P phosphatase)
MLVMDVDGVMTDGRIVMGSDGTEYKNFHVHDGYGITRARKCGLLLGIISGRVSKVTTLRARRLGITDCIQGAEDKLAASLVLLRKYRLSHDQIAFIGDDEFDIPLLQRVGVSAAPSNAVAAVREEVDYVTKAAGGHGAVREFIDIILREQHLI